MRNDYFNSDAFKEILDKYEASEEQGTTCYFDAEDFVDIADFYLLSDRPEDAVRVIDHGLAQHQDDEELKSTLSGAYIYMHRYDEAREIVETLNPDEGNIMYQRAQLTYAIDKDIPLAEEIFTDWIAVEEEESKYDKEEERGERIRDAYLHVLTSFIELCDEKYDEELVKRWVEEYYARFAPLGAYEFDLVLADLVRNENMADMVEKIYTSILEYDPYVNYGWTVLSTAQIINGHYQEALDSIEFALAIDPNNLDALLNKAHALYSLGNKHDALPLFERFLNEIDDVNQYLPYALCLISEQREEEAFPYLQKTEENVLLHKDNVEFYAQVNYELAEAYISLSKLENALACVKRIIEIIPDDEDSLLLKGTIHLLLFEFDECVRCFTLCIRYARDKIRMTCTIALRFLWHNQNELGLKILDTAETYGSDDPSYRIINAYRAYAYMQMGNIEEFLSCIKQACEECPDVVAEIFYDKMPATVKPEEYYKWLVEHPLD